MKAFPVKQSWLDGMDHWATPIMVNLLWALLSLLVITMPLAMIGLFGVMFRWTNRRSPQVFSVFFGTIRRGWLKAYALAGLDLLVGGLVLLNLLIFQVMGTSDLIAFVSRSVTIGAGVLLLLVNLYAWALIAVWDAPFRQIIKLSVQLVFAEPLWTFGIFVGVAAALIASVFLPAVIFVALTGAVAAYIVSRGAWTVVTKYVEVDQFPWLDVN